MLLYHRGWLRRKRNVLIFLLIWIGVNIFVSKLASQGRSPLISLMRTFARLNRVKSGNFEHQVNSDIYLQTVEIQMRRLLMRRLIRIFTVCLVSLFYSNT